MERRQLVDYLDEYLDVAGVPDAPVALNGLQVEGSRDVQTIATATDACTATVQEAIDREADLMIVHHGLFWGGLQPMTGTRMRPFKLLMDNGVALYSAHLPLDVHPDVGNNAVLLDQLGLEPSGRFGTDDDLELGLWADVDIRRHELIGWLQSLLGHHVMAIGAGPDHIGRLGLITGGAGKFIHEAHERDLDAFVTGEAKHPEAVAAEEYGINLVLGGHYATETFGPHALGEHLREQFGLTHTFIDHPFPT
ncbi:MAG: Nif3-like dinuclear metal center hexameric protein [Candidatus Bipolaricaulia bacterium]